MINKTAILFFTRTAKAEAKHKKLSSVLKADVNIYKSLINNTTSILKKTDLPFFIYTENLQIGNTFGEKLENATAQIFNKGFSQVIIIGNDCQNLTADAIINADNKLPQTGAVIGATQYGGVYLLGITKNIFATLNFKSINWQTTAVANDIKIQVSQLYILPMQNEISVWQDIIFYKRSLYKISTVALNLKSILNSIIFYFYHPPLQSYNKFCFIKVYNRPPPVL